VHRQIVVIVLKYGLGLGILIWVVWSHLSRPYDDLPTLAASTIGLAAAPCGEGPIYSACALFPGRPGRDVGIVGVLGQPIHLGFLLLAGVVCVTGILLTFVRWYLLVRAQDIPFTLASALRLGLVGYYFSTFLPGSVGGDIIKAACIAWEQSRRTVAVATVVIDRVVGLCGLLWLAALLGGLFWATGMLEDMAGAESARTLETIVLGAVGLAAASLIFWIALGLLSEARSVMLAQRLERLPKLGHALAEVWRAVWLYRRRGRAIAMTLGMSTISHAGFVLTFYFSARGLFPAAEIPSLATHFLIVPVGMMIKGFFPAPGGVGGGEYGYGTLYKLVQFSFAAGVLASLAQRVIEWTWALVGYLIYLRMRPTLPTPVPEEAPAPATPAGVS
jgi:uncharacterized membrane protein YbhN (UPF0104 family)